MGKQEADVLGEPPASDSPTCCGSRCKWPIPVILGIYVLAFALWSICFRGGSSNDSQRPSPPPLRLHVEASFRLRRSVSEVQESLPQLQLDLQNEIGIPDTQIDIVLITPLPYKNWTEVRFTVSPDEPNEIAPAELSLLKDTFVELFTQRSANLSLTSTLFGKVSHFEVLHFPGGITVVPAQPGFPLSKVLVLFNFTLHDSLTHVHRNFAKFRLQLANGIILKPTESLFVQLTNLEGSTVNSPLVVQTSILPVVGVMLPSTRLKQLALEIMASPRRNLGLNHTLFGRVKKIELSSFLEYTLESPSPSPSPAPALSPNTSPGSSERSRHRGSKRHWQHSRSSAPADAPYYHKGRPTSRSIAPAPQHQQQRHSEAALAPSYPPSLGFPSSPSSSPFIEPPCVYNEPPSPFSSAIVPSGPIKSQPIESPPPADVSSARPTFLAPTSLKAPSVAPLGLAPGLAPSPSQLHKRIAFVPVASSPSTSSGIIIGVPVWIVVICMVLLVGIW